MVLYFFVFKGNEGFVIEKRIILVKPLFVGTK